jgi:hypothetical protein
VIGYNKVMDWEGWVTRVIRGLIGAVIYFIWNIFKSKRESKKREEVVLSKVKAELLSNLCVLQYNQTVLQKELEIINEDGIPISPSLILLQNKFSTLVKNNFSPKLREDIVDKIREIDLLTMQINEQIRNRKNDQNNDQAMLYYPRLQLYDKMLLENIESLQKMVEEVLPLL